MTTRTFDPTTTSGLEGAPVPPGHTFITEMFSGIQGEGPYVGVRQIFVRFGGCDLRCWWCDTPKSLVRRDPARIETAPASREFETVENPQPIDAARSLLRRLRPADHHSVTFTGGEPLLQPEAIRALAAEAHTAGSKTWLETHGGRIGELAEVIDLMDVVSMDIKVLSSSGETVPLEIHAEFLAIARRSDVFTKLVVTPDTIEEDVVRAASMVASAGSDIPFILQPVTPFGRIKSAPTPESMLELQAKCLQVHPHTRVIPQTHKFLGQM